MLHAVIPRTVCERASVSRHAFAAATLACPTFATPAATDVNHSKASLGVPASSQSTCQAPTDLDE
eukprot:6471615-Prymnesium_polylepis.2